MFLEATQCLGSRPVDETSLAQLAAILEAGLGLKPATVTVSLHQPAVSGSAAEQRFLIQDDQGILGVLIVKEAPWSYNACWESELLHSIAQHIAIALRTRQQSEHERWSALLEERRVIARELHDSLAQALSYLIIQTAVLEQRLRPSPAWEAAKPMLSALEIGLDNAYKQLREFLATFRLHVNAAGLQDALEQTVAEFRQHSRLSILLDIDEHCAHQLSASAEIHVLHIIREALSNAVRHANATVISVNLAMDSEQRTHLSIKDNGIGLDMPVDQPGHFGLAIMRERARGLGTELQIDADQHGTCVYLVFSHLVRTTESVLRHVS